MTISCTRNSSSVINIIFWLISETKVPIQGAKLPSIPIYQAPGTVPSLEYASLERVSITKTSFWSLNSLNLEGSNGVVPLCKISSIFVLIDLFIRTLLGKYCGGGFNPEITSSINSSLVMSALKA